MHVHRREHGRLHRQRYFCTFISRCPNFPSSPKRLEGGVHPSILTTQVENGQCEAPAQLRARVVKRIVKQTAAQFCVEKFVGLDFRAFTLYHIIVSDSSVMER